MENRITAILSFKSLHEENVASIIGYFSKYSQKTYVFIQCGQAHAEIAGVEFIEYPETADTEPKRRNWVNMYFKNAGFRGFLHVIADTVEFMQDPGIFMSDLETMMKVMDYGVWFNTACDACNYVYGRYSPRMYISIDRPDARTSLALPGRINFTSHSNSQYIVYDMSQVSDDLLKFDEDFTIPMFWIIEFLARRRNTKAEGQLYYMNQYMTPGSETGVFGNLKTADSSKDDSATMKKEDLLFRQKNFKYEQNGNIDEILECFWRKIQVKMEKQA